MATYRAAGAMKHAGLLVGLLLMLPTMHTSASSRTIRAQGLGLMDWVSILVGLASGLASLMRWVGAWILLICHCVETIDEI